MTVPQSPVLEVIRELQESAETGFLALGQTGQVITVYFRDGLISAVSTNITQHQLGQYLTRRGYLQNGDAHSLAEEARKHRSLIGETAVNKQLLDGSELMDLVQEQAAQVLAHAIKSKFEVRSFTRSVPPSFFMPARIDHPQLMLELARINL
ncbi:MAG TPA: DUF4388 domain-containing protein, partial [Acidobacteriota bacterium]|nr:DUF4388 domain-containing protein [Acidobacteriota bacterium]